MDWGGGDWENGARRRVPYGPPRTIAEYLLEKGARIDIFCAAMMGLVDAVKAFLTLQTEPDRRAGAAHVLAALPRPGRRRPIRESARLLAIGEENRTEAQPVPEEAVTVPRETHARIADLPDGQAPGRVAGRVALLQESHVVPTRGRRPAHLRPSAPMPFGLMQDVYFLEWRIDPGPRHREAGDWLHRNAESDLGALCTHGGAHRAVQTPSFSTIRPRSMRTATGRAGFFELTGALDGTLTAQEYHDFLTEAWPQTQRLIKGQLNSTDDE